MHWYRVLLTTSPKVDKAYPKFFTKSKGKWGLINMVQGQGTKLEALSLLKDHPRMNYKSKQQLSFREKIGFPRIARSPEPLAKSDKILEELQTESSNSSQAQKEEFLPRSTKQNKALFKVLSPERRKDDWKTKTIKVFLLYQHLGLSKQ